MSYQLKDGMKVLVLGQEGFIFDPIAKTYYYLNDTAAQILSILAIAKAKDGGVSAQLLKDVLVALYDVLEVEAENDVNVLLEDLATQGIVEPTAVDAVLPAPTAYPWKREDYTAPELTQTPGEFRELAREHWGLPIIWPKILVA